MVMSGILLFITSHPYADTNFIFLPFKCSVINENEKINYDIWYCLYQGMCYLVCRNIMNIPINCVQNIVRKSEITLHFSGLKL
jgi:hypothetical protein